jgi:hypothetical protein
VQTLLLLVCEGFVGFTSLTDAATAAQLVYSREASRMDVSRAPEPRNIVWDAIVQPMWEREMRSICSLGLFIAATFFFSLMVSRFSQFVFATGQNSAVVRAKALLPESFAEYLDGLLPGLGLVLFKTFAPSIMQFVVIVIERPSTRSEVETSLMGYVHSEPCYVLAMPTRLA